MAEHLILLLDPFKNITSSYRTVLEGEKYSVETAININEAFVRLSQRRHSILIMEYLPPLEDTFRLIQWLKQDSPETYILMVTHANIDPTTYETLFDIGLDDFILKPYPPEKILVHVKKGIRQRDLILRKHEVEDQALLDRVARRIQQPIFNTAYFRKCLRQELKRAKRHKHPLSLLLVQIPAKEKLGDRWEDFCLELAKIIRKYTREEDLVGRENGDFGILLPETDQPGSQAVVKRLSHLIQHHPFFQSDESLKPLTETLSFQSFTYPEMFRIPESLMPVLEGVNKEYPHN